MDSSTKVSQNENNDLSFSELNWNGDEQEPIIMNRQPRRQDLMHKVNATNIQKNKSSQFAYLKQMPKKNKNHKNQKNRLKTQQYYVNPHLFNSRKPSILKKKHSGNLTIISIDRQKKTIKNNQVIQLKRQIKGMKNQLKEQIKRVKEQIKGVKEQTKGVKQILCNIADNIQKFLSGKKLEQLSSIKKRQQSFSDML